jgi:hypothetical protein
MFWLMHSLLFGDCTNRVPWRLYLAKLYFSVNTAGKVQPVLDFKDPDAQRSRISHSDSLMSSNWLSSGL